MALFGKKDEVRLKIAGMHCGNCQQKVGDALRGVPGVAAANVDLMFHKATVRVEPGTDVGALVAAVKAAGYDATPV